MRNVINTNMSSLWGSGGLNNYLGKSNSSSSSSDSNLGVLDYNTVKGVGYQKAIKSYYKNDIADAALKAATDSKADFKDMADAATNMKNSADTLMNKSLYKENDKGEIDRDSLIKEMKSFVKDYNDVVEKAGNSKDKATLRNGVWMTKMVEKNKGLLSEIGISVGKDNKLSIDETGVKRAKTSTLKSVMTGRDSVAGKISRRASNFVAAANRGMANGTYTNRGSYSKTGYNVTSRRLNKEV